jgi:hypothetical protein
MRSEQSERRSPPTVWAAAHRRHAAHASSPAIARVSITAYQYSMHVAIAINDAQSHTSHLTYHTSRITPHTSKPNPYYTLPTHHTPHIEFYCESSDPRLEVCSARCEVRNVHH